MIVSIIICSLILLTIVFYILLLNSKKLQDKIYSNNKSNLFEECMSHLELVQYDSKYLHSYYFNYKQYRLILWPSGETSFHYKENLVSAATPVNEEISFELGRLLKEKFKL